MQTIGKHNRYLGAMLGTLIGDAIAARFEYKKQAEIGPVLEAEGGLHMVDYIDPWKGKRQMQKGHPTDDSELAAALGLSLCAYPDFNAEDLYDRLRSFIHGRKSILTDDRAYGAGSTLRAALLPETYAESVALFEKGEIPLLPANGSLMRCIAVPLRHCGNIISLIEVAEAQSRVTHQHDESVSACIAFSVLVSFVLDGVEPGRAWHYTRQVLPWIRAEAMQKVLAIQVSEPTEDEIWPNPGNVLLTLRIALWASVTAKDFRDGITKVTAIGGDTDTYAAVAGGILGAHFGYEGIPLEWLRATPSKANGIMRQIAADLYELQK